MDISHKKIAFSAHEFQSLFLPTRTGGFAARFVPQRINVHYFSCTTSCTVAEKCCFSIINIIFMQLIKNLFSITFLWLWTFYGFLKKKDKNQQRENQFQSGQDTFLLELDLKEVTKMQVNTTTAWPCHGSGNHFLTVVDYDVDHS